MDCCEGSARFIGILLVDEGWGRAVFIIITWTTDAPCWGFCFDAKSRLSPKSFARSFNGNNVDANDSVRESGGVRYVLICSVDLAVF